MRNLAKLPKPLVLVRNETEWLREVDQMVTAGQDPTSAQLSRYNHPEIKHRLLEETHDKCAYCESKVRHITYGDIEHVIPKNKAPHLRFRWENLTIACDVCNTKKSNKLGIIDPYTDNPEASFFFTGPTIFAKQNCETAEYTEISLELNRIKLVERRVKILERITYLVRAAKRVSNPEIRAAMIDDIKANEARDDVEFSVMARTYIEGLVATGFL